VLFGDVPRLEGMLPRAALLAGIWAGLVGLLIAVGQFVTHSAAVTGFDQRVTRDVVSSRTPALNTAMTIVTWFGSWVALLAVAGAVVALVLTRRLRVPAAVAAAVAWAGEALGVHVAKDVTGRHRPPQDIWLVRAHGWSFPSGHAATAAFAFTVLALCVAVLTRAWLARVAGWLTAGAGIAATAFSRVELGVHWTTDVLGSVAFVACWLTGIRLCLGWPRPRPRTGQGENEDARDGADAGGHGEHRVEAAGERAVHQRREAG
jgi:undecaprenyl-diphosphatase